MQEHCLVTGGAGFIGSHVVDALVNAGKRVIIIDNFSSGKEENVSQHKKNERIVIYKKDITEDLLPIFKENKITSVFHLAAIASVQESMHNPLHTHKTNATGTLNLLEQCRKYGVRRFIFSSSASIYGDTEHIPTSEEAHPKPKSPYATQKFISEQYCELYHRIYGIETINLRYFNVYGQRQDENGAYASLIPKFFTMYKKGETPIINGDGNQTRDFVFIEDIVKANMLAESTNNKECFGKTFNIGSGKSTSINEVAKYIQVVTQSTRSPVHGPEIIEPRNSQAEITLAKKMLNWNPIVSFKEGLEKTYEFYKR